MLTTLFSFSYSSLEVALGNLFYNSVTHVAQTVDKMDPVDAKQDRDEKRYAPAFSISEFFLACFFSMFLAGRDACASVILNWPCI